MSLISTTAALLMAAVLLWAGVEKAHDLAPTTATIRSLGVPLARAKPIAMLLVFTELGVALGLVLMPHSVWTQAGVVALAVTFALAGIIALWSDQPIRCSCFGSRGNSYLGRNQVVALLPWLVGVVLVHVTISEPLLLSEGASRLAGLGLAIAMVRAGAVWRARNQALEERRSAQEMFIWLR